VEGPASLESTLESFGIVAPSELQALPSIYSWLLLLADMLAEYVSKAINNAGINISGNEEERIESLFN